MSRWGSRACSASDMRPLCDQPALAERSLSLTPGPVMVPGPWSVMMWPEEGTPCHADNQVAAHHPVGDNAAQPRNGEPAQRTTSDSRSLLPSPARRPGRRSDRGPSGPSSLHRPVRHLPLDRPRHPAAGPVPGRQHHQDLRRHGRPPTRPGAPAAAVGHSGPASGRAGPRTRQRRPPHHSARPAHPHQRPVRLHGRHGRPPRHRHRRRPCGHRAPPDELHRRFRLLQHQLRPARPRRSARHRTQLRHRDPPSHHQTLHLTGTSLPGARTALPAPHGRGYSRDPADGGLRDVTALDPRTAAPRASSSPHSPI